MRERSIKVKGSNMNTFDREEYILKYAISVDRIIRGAERGVASRTVTAKALVKAGKPREADALASITSDSLHIVSGKLHRRITAARHKEEATGILGKLFSRTRAAKKKRHAAMMKRYAISDEAENKIQGTMLDMNPHSRAGSGAERAYRSISPHRYE